MMQLPTFNALFEARYQFREVLGVGGFATVFLARDNDLERDVAVKVLRPEVTGYAQGMEARFTREVDIIANLTDQHTVTMFDFGRSQSGLLFMVFEYVEGRDLAELIRGAGSLDQRTTTRIARQVLMSLREAHAAGLLHRDIKPENIRIYEYLGDPLCVKVLDFGIARLVSPGTKALTQTGGVVGTPLYMSPEQVLGAELSRCSDLYSLGLVMYEMLMGRGSLKEVNSPGEQLKRLTHRRSLELPPSAPADEPFRALIGKMLRVNSSERFQSAGEVLEELRVAVDELSEAEDYALDATEGFAVGRPAAPEPTVPAPSDDDEHGISWQFAAVVISLVLVCVVVAVVGMRSGSDTPPPGRAVFRLPEPAAVVAPAPRTHVEQPKEPVAAEKVGCGGEVPQFGVREDSLLGPGLDRLRYLTYVPENYDPQKKHPILLLFHSSFEGPLKFLERSGFASIADEEGLVLVAPFGGKGEWDPPNFREIEAVLDRATEQLCVDRSRVYAVGYASGARVVERMPCDYPVSAIASIGYRGRRGDEVCQPERPIPYVHLGGTKDGYNLVEGGSGSCLSAVKLSFDRKEEIWGQSHGCSGKPKRFGIKGDSYCKRWECDTPFVSCRLDAGRIYQVDMVDLGCQGPQVDYPIAEKIWGFFEAHGVDLPPN